MSSTSATSSRASLSDLFEAPCTHNDADAQAELLALDADYVDPLARGVAGYRWTPTELAAYGAQRYGAVRARIEKGMMRVGGEGLFGRLVDEHEMREISVREVRMALAGCCFLARTQLQQRQRRRASTRQRRRASRTRASTIGRGSPRRACRPASRRPGS